MAENTPTPLARLRLPWRTRWPKKSKPRSVTLEQNSEYLQPSNNSLESCSNNMRNPLDLEVKEDKNLKEFSDDEVYVLKQELDKLLNVEPGLPEQSDSNNLRSDEESGRPVLTELDLDENTELDAKSDLDTQTDLYEQSDIEDELAVVEDKNCVSKIVQSKSISQKMRHNRKDSKLHPILHSNVDNPESNVCVTFEGKDPVKVKDDCNVDNLRSSNTFDKEDTSIGSRFVRDVANVDISATSMLQMTAMAGALVGVLAEVWELM